MCQHRYPVAHGLWDGIIKWSFIQLVHPVSSDADEVPDFPESYSAVSMPGVSE